MTIFDWLVSERMTLAPIEMSKTNMDAVVADEISISSRGVSLYIKVTLSRGRQVIGGTKPDDLVKQSTLPSGTVSSALSKITS